MKTAKNTTGAIVFLALSLVIIVYDVVGTYTHPEWGAKTPGPIMDAMPFLMNVFVPLVFVAAGFAALYALMGDRRGFAAIIALSLLFLVWNAFPAVWRLQAGALGGAAICVYEMIVALITITYCLRALNKGHRDRDTSATAKSHV